MIKKFVLLLVLVVFCTPAMAGTVDVVGQKDNTFFESVAISTLQSATGNGTDVYLLPAVMKSFTWQCVVASGTATNVTASLMGSIDNATYVVLDTTELAGGDIRHVVNKPVRYLKAYIPILTGSSPGVTLNVMGSVY